jgi:SAM-dependent methyltransferase
LTEPTTYDPEFFDQLAAIEDRHFWFRARNRIIADAVRQHTRHLAPGYLVLEVGCGTGNVLRMLEQVCDSGQVIGMDLFAQGLRFARQRTSCGLVQGDMRAHPFHTQFQVVGLFDVLEHLPDDETVLQLLHEMLAPGGVLLLTVPAHMSLWSYFDEAAHHCRRYDLAEMQAKLTRAGYRVDFASYFMAPLYPIAWLSRRLRSLTTRSNSVDVHHAAEQELQIVPIVNEVFYGLASLEAKYLSGQHRVPIGSSLIAVACRID